MTPAAPRTAAFAVNRSIPIKFQLTGYNNSLVTSLSAVISLRVMDATGANVLTNPQLDPFGKIPEFKYCAAKVEPVAEAVQVAAE